MSQVYPAPQTTLLTGDELAITLADFDTRYGKLPESALSTEEELVASLGNINARYGKSPELAAAQAELAELFHQEKVEEDLTLEDLAASEQMLKDSLFTVGRMGGLSDREIELDWQRICLDAQFNVQFADIHIEQL